MPDIKAYIHAFSTLHVAQTEGHTSLDKLFVLYNNFNEYLSRDIDSKLQASPYGL